ncbi:MAG: MBL fold metallo-hydrolase [Planctomycetota bacterium]|nr:MBL fold metallo-hydrolase [Planctomycetota bacterium]
MIATVSKHSTRSTVSVLVMLLATVSLTLVATPPLPAAEKGGYLDIYFIDVEGGACTLFVSPSGESLVIDSGYPDNNGRDLKRILHVVKNVAGLKHIDNAAVTHWHRDHYGNHAALSTQIKIKNFWDRGIPDALSEDDQFEARVADYRAASQNKSKALKAGDNLPVRSGKTPYSVRIMTASREVIKNTGKRNPFAKLHEPKPEDKSDNAASLSFLLEFGKFRFLCCGDLTWNIEAKLMTPNNPVGKVDMYMVTHHGLPSSNNPVLVRAIAPRVAVMCNGPTKGGSESVLKTLGECKSLKALYQLHRNVKLDPALQTPANYIANGGTTEGCEGVWVKARVAPGGKSYTVQIGPKGVPRRFKSR